MPSIFSRLKFTWDYVVKGRHRRPPLPDFDYPLPDPRLMKFLEGMYREHGVEAVRIDNWICVDGGRLLTRASHFNHSQSPGSTTLQADFVTLAAGNHIIESFGGIGTDELSAVLDACQNFQDSTFHALFVSLLDRPCEHVDREVWTIGGQPRQITLGWMRMRGNFPKEQWPTIFEGIQRDMEALSLPPGLHWVRYFYFRPPSGEPTIEVLVDNETHESLQDQTAHLPWPAAEEFYTVRLFFTIQDA